MKTSRKTLPALSPNVIPFRPVARRHGGQWKPVPVFVDAGIKVADLLRALHSAGLTIGHHDRGICIVAATRN